MRRDPKTLAALVAAGLMLAPIGLRAQDQPINRDQGQSQAQAQQEDFRSLTDAQFLQRAAQGGLMEVSTSKLVNDRTDDDALERFAEQMVDDHTKVNKELVRLAESKGVDIPNRLDERHRAMFDRMEKMQRGPTFEREYIQQQVKAHEQAVKLFSAMAEEADDAEIQAFARKALPNLRHHLQMARERAGLPADETTSPDTDRKSGR